MFAFSDCTIIYYYYSRSEAGHCYIIYIYLKPMLPIIDYHTSLFILSVVIILLDLDIRYLFKVLVP